MLENKTLYEHSRIIMQIIMFNFYEWRHIFTSWRINLPGNEKFPLCLSIAMTGMRFIANKLWSEGRISNVGMI